jgi:hypothetical protein
MAVAIQERLNGRALAPISHLFDDATDIEPFTPMM